MKTSQAIGIIWTFETLMPVLYILVFMLSAATGNLIMLGIVLLLLFLVMLVYIPLKLTFAIKMIRGKIE